MAAGKNPCLFPGATMSGSPGCGSKARCIPRITAMVKCIAGSINEQYYLVGLSATGVKNFEVDNNELRGWAWASVSLRQANAANIHHNYIHHNQARGEGYGVCLYGGNALIEANLFDYNRHDVTGAGMSGRAVRGTVQPYSRERECNRRCSFRCPPG